jgi:hypothetical protein
MQIWRLDAPLGGRAPIRGGRSGSSDHDPGAASGRGVRRTDRRVVADCGVRYAYVMRVGVRVVGLVGLIWVLSVIP